MPPEPAYLHRGCIFINLLVQYKAQILPVLGYIANPVGNGLLGRPDIHSLTVHQDFSPCLPVNPINQVNCLGPFGTHQPGQPHYLALMYLHAHIPDHISPGHALKLQHGDSIIIRVVVILGILDPAVRIACHQLGYLCFCQFPDIIASHQFPVPHDAGAAADTEHLLQYMGDVYDTLAHLLQPPDDLEQAFLLIIGQ